MALIKCKECGHDVSTEAKACTNCGAKPKKPASVVQVIVGLFAVAVVLSMFSGKSEPSADGQAAPVQDEAACRQDLRCWGERGMSTAHVMCRGKVEALAKHSVKWTDEGMFDQKFSRYSWQDQANGMVTYFGDKAQFQNGFGAYTNVIYACDVDVAAKKAISATLVGEGRLSDS